MASTTNGRSVERVATAIPRSVSLFHLYLAVMASAYVFVAVHTPMTVIPVAPHDDGLFVSLGRYLSEGKWLGPFNEFTLMKGPRFSAFLAMGNWLGLPVSFELALFHCGAICLFVSIVRRYINSDIIAGVLYALLLWHPITLTLYLRRILREDIYYAQTLIIFAGIAFIFFCPRRWKSLVFHSVAVGALLGWFWLTREEGIWILPAIGLIGLAALVRAFRVGRARELAVSSLIIFAVFASIQIGFRAVNLFEYGKFVGVDVEEKNFLAALKAIHSVRSGGINPFVSVTLGARKRIYAVSPAFASLAPYFDGPGGEGWTLSMCRVLPISCGDMPSGHFMWFLRGVAAAQGHYSSPAKASAFFGQMANEINNACARGDLECVPQIISEMPPVNWRDVANSLPVRYVEAFNLLLFTTPPQQINPSGGPEAAFLATLRFLNYPLHTRPADVPISLPTYTLSGWYYKSGGAWFSVTAKAPNGAAADIRIDRSKSPDIQSYTKDPAASDQRFAIGTRCVDECALTFETSEGAKVEKTLADFRRDGLEFAIGGGRLHVDSMTKQPDPEYVETPVEKLSRRVRETVLTYYYLLFVPVLIAGALAFLTSTVLFPRSAIANVCYILAAASWLLVFVRASLLILIDATSFHVLFASYISPAYFMLVSAAVLSCAACLQLCRGLRHRRPSPLRG